MTTMAKQIYFEDVEVGTEIGPLEKNPTTQQLVRYAGASGDFYQIHYDKDFALGNGLPGVILHGALKNAFLGHLMTDFAGELGWLRKLGVQYRGMDQPGTKVVARGKISKKYTDGGYNLVDCEIWLENAKGEKTTPRSLNAEALNEGRVDSHYTKVLLRLLAAHAMAEKLTALGYQRALATLDNLELHPIVEKNFEEEKKHARLIYRALE